MVYIKFPPPDNETLAEDLEELHARVDVLIEHVVLLETELFALQAAVSTLASPREQA